MIIGVQIPACLQVLIRWSDTRDQDKYFIDTGIDSQFIVTV